MTFEWVGNGSTFSHPYPWWISPAEVSTTIHSNINDMDRATCTNLACFSHIKHYPQTKRSCVVDDTECFGEVDSSDSSSCWFCTTCGRLNAVIPFRLRWSWICRHCKVNVSRSVTPPSHLFHSYRRPWVDLLKISISNLSYFKTLISFHLHFLYRIRSRPSTTAYSFSSLSKKQLSISSSLRRFG